VSPHEELRALLQRYARAVDERDIDTLTSLFHPDAVVTGTGGTQPLEEWLKTMRAPRAFPQSMHVICEPLIALDEAGATATLDAYAIVHQLSEPASGTGDLILGMRYLDDAVVHRGRWVFARRTARTLWMR
jgi:ketosteroid isomerase-like protein